MGKWIKEVEFPHFCLTPSATARGVGSIWECECKQQWIISNNPSYTVGATQYNQMYPIEKIYTYIAPYWMKYDNNPEKT